MATQRENEVSINGSSAAGPLRHRRDVLDASEAGRINEDSHTRIVSGDVTGPPIRPNTQTAGDLLLFCEGAPVSVARLDGGGSGGAVGEQEIGVGTLLFEIRVGEPVQIALDGAQILRTTPLCGLSATGTGSLEIVTRRSTYRLRLR